MIIYKLKKYIKKSCNSFIFVLYNHVVFTCGATDNYLRWFRLHGGCGFEYTSGVQLDEWKGENLNKSSVKVYDCRVEQGVIRVKASLSGISRAPVVRFELVVKIYADGEICFQLDGNVRPDAIWLPRFGYEFTMPGEYCAFTYFGNGPFESYRDMRHAGMVGIHCSNVDAEYVPYVRPQEHGNHTDSKWLRIGNLEFAAEDDFEINVSKYSSYALTVAEHTDELVADGYTHVRIDYKVSGLGSNSCGPDLEKQYRLDEKRIDFAFRIRPTV